MASKNLWIGITVGVFFVGLTIGYVTFSGPAYSGNMMMNNQQMIKSMVQDPKAMKMWMQDPQHVQEMGTMMRDDHDFAMQMMLYYN